jgi:hypothetical protein
MYMRKFGIAILSIILTISIAGAQTKAPDTTKAAKATVKADSVITPRGPVKSLG